MSRSTELLADPIAQLRAWYAEAERQVESSDVVALATASADALPSVRMVNFKGWIGDELTFYTNHESRKGRELAENPHATMLFYWPGLKRQVQVCGSCRKLSATQSQAYFATRDRESQLSAWMSRQSAELCDFDEMERLIEEWRDRFAGRDIPCPAYWGGYGLKPERIEFRVARPHRRHWRWEYTRRDSGWASRKLFP